MPKEGCVCECGAHAGHFQINDSGIEVEGREGGRSFESSSSRNQPFVFKVGAAAGERMQKVLKFQMVRQS